MQKKNSKEIKSCPCCGGKAILIINNYMGMQYNYVCCVDCRIRTEVYITMDDGELAIETWNKRIEEK